MLDTIGATELGFGDDVPYDERAWEQVARGRAAGGRRSGRGVLPPGAPRGARRPAGRPRPLSRLRFLPRPARPPARALAALARVEPPRWGGGARFAVALSHDVDIPWRWTRQGIRGGARRLKDAVLARDGGESVAPGPRARGHSAPQAPRHRPELQLRAHRRARARAGRRVGLLRSLPGSMSPRTGRRRRPTPGCCRASSRRCSSSAAEIGLHASYSAAFDAAQIAAEKAALERLGATLHGQRYHYLRVDPHTNLAPLAELGFAYDSSLGFSDALGFRAGIAHPFRPWSTRRRPPARPRRDPARRDGRDARGAALPRAVGRRRRSDACSRSSTGRPSTAGASRSSGTRTVSTARPQAAGMPSTRGRSTRSMPAAASASRRTSSRAEALVTLVRKRVESLRL